MKTSKISKIWSLTSQNTDMPSTFELADMLNPETKRLMDSGIAFVTNIDVATHQEGDRVYVVDYSNGNYIELPANLFGAEYTYEKEN